MLRLAKGAAIALVLAAGHAVPVMASDAGKSLAFEVFRGDDPIGHHIVTLSETPAGTQVDIEISLEVSFAFITLYDYEHRNREVWRDGKLVSLETQTNDNGESFQVSGQAREDGFWVESTSGSYLAPAGIFPTSYWRSETMSKGQLLDTQSGRLIDVEVAAKGRESIAGMDRPVQAERYNVSGDLNLDIWYGPAGDWTGLRFAARGADIEYRRVDAAQLAGKSAAQ